VTAATQYCHEHSCRALLQGVHAVGCEAVALHYAEFQAIFLT